MSTRRRRPVKKINKNMKKKLAVLFSLVLLALVGLVARITYINATSGSKYRKQVLSQAQQKYENQTLPAKRGDIYDRNGNILATSNKVYNVILDCLEVNKDEDSVEPTIKALVEVLGLDEDEMRKLLDDDSTKSSQYQIVKKQISMDDKKAFESYENPGDDSELTAAQKKERSKITGVWFEEDYLRSYPFNETACDTVGFTLSRDVADIGLEGYYNATLTGVDGRQYGYINNNSDVEQTIIEPTDGKSIETSLDLGLQQIVEKYVNTFEEKMGAKNVGVIIEDPKTGEIMAMDGGDRYDLNNPRDFSNVYSENEIAAMSDEETVDALNGMWSNFCVTDAYEPGSVVKPIVMSSALEMGAISETDNFVCDGGQSFGAEGATTFIKCAVWPDAHGTETLADVIANSCNDGMMQIAAKMGKDNFLKTQSTFNFGTRTGIDLPNEGSGVITAAAFQVVCFVIGILADETLSDEEIDAGMAGKLLSEFLFYIFQVGFVVGADTHTMIQEINAMCSVINGGYYYQPHLVTRIKDSSGGIVKTISPILMKQTISEKISADIRSYMAASVDHGTSRTSKVQGYSSGGKPGTAEKLPRGNGKYLVSFIGFAPVDDPALVIYVVVDEPNVEDQASSTYAQYIAQGILSEALPYLNVQPDEAEDGEVPTTELWDIFKGISDSATGSAADGQKEAISDENVPSPPEDDSEDEDTEDNNDMQSDGLTNEEAGLE